MYIPQFVWYIVAFIIGYGICWIINIDNICTGKETKAKEEARLDAYIAAVRADHQASRAEYEARRAKEAEIGKETVS